MIPSHMNSAINTPPRKQGSCRYSRDSMWLMVDEIIWGNNARTQCICNVTSNSFTKVMVIRDANYQSCEVNNLRMYIYTNLDSFSFSMQFYLQHLSYNCIPNDQFANCVFVFVCVFVLTCHVILMVPYMQSLHTPWIAMISAGMVLDIQENLSLSSATKWQKPLHFHWNVIMVDILLYLSKTSTTLYCISQPWLLMPCQRKEPANQEPDNLPSYLKTCGFWIASMTFFSRDDFTLDNMPSFLKTQRKPVWLMGMPDKFIK